MQSLKVSTYFFFKGLLYDDVFNISGNLFWKGVLSVVIDNICRRHCYAYTMPPGQVQQRYHLRSLSAHQEHNIFWDVLCIKHPSWQGCVLQWFFQQYQGFQVFDLIKKIKKLCHLKLVSKGWCALINGHSSPSFELHWSWILLITLGEECRLLQSSHAGSCFPL